MNIYKGILAVKNIRNKEKSVYIPHLQMFVVHPGMKIKKWEEYKPARCFWDIGHKVGLSPFKRNICFNNSPSKNDEKCCWFHCKSSFDSQDI